MEEYTVKNALTLNPAIFTDRSGNTVASIDDAIYLCVTESAGKPVFTIADTDEASTFSSIVNLPCHDDKIALSINPESAQQIHLEISARLSKPARIVSAEPLTDTIPMLKLLC